jgi:Na+/H+-dicarboxylate symporter
MKNLFGKFSKKQLVSALVIAVCMSFTMISTFALDTETSTAMSTSMTSVKTDALSALALVAPMAITIMGAFLVWKYGIRFFKSLAK